MKEIKNLLIYHIHNKELKRCANKYLHGKLIDIGCGEKPYENLLSEFIKEHTGVDHENTMHDKSRIDLFGSAYKIPAPDSAFDSAICTAVLEHLEEPEQAIRECYRVLKPGGYAFYSVPFIWHLHEEPRDYYRFSKFGLKYIFEKAGFENIEIKALSGFWVTFGQLLVYNLYRLNRKPLKWTGFVPALGLLVQLTAYILDRIDRAEQWTWMYIIVVRKEEKIGNDRA